jgi:hypothetical protein
MEKSIRIIAKGPGFNSHSASVNPLGPPPGVHKTLSNLDFSSYPNIENLVLREAALCLSETTGDVILGQLVPGAGEDPIGGSNFDEVAQVKVGCALRYARGLLHGVRNDGD